MNTETVRTAPPEVDVERPERVQHPSKKGVGWIIAGSMAALGGHQTVGRLAPAAKSTSPGSGARLRGGSCCTGYEATLKWLASRAPPPSQGRSLLPPPIRPVPPCNASVQGTPYSQ
jgi:hypothetical protein